MNHQSDALTRVLRLLEITVKRADREELKNTDKDKLFVYHFGLGLFIRNHFLSEENALYQEFLKQGIDHKDDMSAEIIRAFHDYLNK